jgi:hypothetical protein
VSDTTDAHGTSLTADELEIYIACEEQGATTFHIWSATRSARDGTWNAAAMVPELFGSGFDVDPDVSPDGLTLYFSTNRSGAAYQIWVSQRTGRDQAWGKPKEVKELSSPTLDRSGPSVDRSGLFMVFHSAPRDTSDYRLYSASRTDPSGSWGAIQELSGINSGMEDADPALFRDSYSLIWSSRGTSQGKTWDLVEVSRLDLSKPFSSQPIPLDSLNTPYAERYPWVSQDGNHIVFSREPETKAGAIYEAWR